MSVNFQVFPSANSSWAKRALVLLALFCSAFTPIPDTPPASPIMTNAAPATSGLSTTEILGDPLSRISNDFHIPQGLNDRVRFWFDVYTKYGEAHHVIHHSLYPWVIFEVVDTTDILAAPGIRWLRRQQATNFVRERKRQIRRTLLKMANRRSFKRLNPLEQQIMSALEPIPGPLKKVLRASAQNLRSQLGQKDFFVSGLKQSRQYLSYMEEIFATHGLPFELTRLPFVESSFNTRAYSRVGASGIWQIMPQTGSAYMKVGPVIDERNSPLKSTYLAAQLLKEYYRGLRSWPLAVTSYNHGIGNIRVAIRRAKSYDLAKIVARYHRGDFKFASSNFYSSFLAALYAEKYHDQLFPYVDKQALFTREVVRLNRRMRFSEVLSMTGLTRDHLLAYNLDIQPNKTRGAVLPRGFELHLPLGYAIKLSPVVVRLDVGSRKQTSG